jgi:hypothetical protein
MDSFHPYEKFIFVASAKLANAQQLSPGKTK